MHGPHQVAQKFTSTIFPLNSENFRTSPLRASIPRVGAGLTSKVGAKFRIQPVSGGDTLFSLDFTAKNHQMAVPVQIISANQAVRLSILLQFIEYEWKQ